MSRTLAAGAAALVMLASTASAMAQTQVAPTKGAATPATPAMAEPSGGFDAMAVLNFFAGGPDAKPFGGMPQDQIDEAVRQGLQLGLGMAARQGLVRPGEDGRPQIGQFPANALPPELRGGGATGVKGTAAPAPAAPKR